MNRIARNIAAGLAAIFLSSPVIAADITLSADKSYITISGGFIKGDNNKLVDLYNSTDDTVTTIVFKDSPGGFLDEGISMGRNIRNVNLSTVVSGYCNSACAYAWAAGTQRGIHAGDTMTWHRPMLAAADGSKATPLNTNFTAEEIAERTAAGQNYVYWYMGNMGYDIRVVATLLASDLVNTDPISLLLLGVATTIVGGE